MEEAKRRKAEQGEAVTTATPAPAQTAAINVAGSQNVAIVAEVRKSFKAFGILKREGTMLYFLRTYSIIDNQIVGVEDSIEDLFGMVMGRMQNEVEDSSL